MISDERSEIARELVGTTNSKILSFERMMRIRLSKFSLYLDLRQILYSVHCTTVSLISLNIPVAFIVLDGVLSADAYLAALVDTRFGESEKA